MRFLGQRERTVFDHSCNHRPVRTSWTAPWVSISHKGTQKGPRRTTDTRRCVSCVTREELREPESLVMSSTPASPSSWGRCYRYLPRLLVNPEQRVVSASCLRCAETQGNHGELSPNIKHLLKVMRDKAWIQRGTQSPPYLTNRSNRPPPRLLEHLKDVGGWEGRGSKLRVCGTNLMREGSLGPCEPWAVCLTRGWINRGGGSAGQRRESESEQECEKIEMETQALAGLAQ